MTFRTSHALPKRVAGLRKYLNEAPFVVLSGKTRGGYDWITIKAFLSSEMADEENDIFRNLFGDIIQTYEVYDFVPQTTASLNALTYTIDLLRNYQQNASFNQTDSSGHGITTKSSFHRILKLTRPHMMSLIQS